MYEVTSNYFDENNSVPAVSLKKTSQNDMKAKILNLEILSPDKTNMENTPSVDSTEDLYKDSSVPNYVTLKSDSNEYLAGSKNTSPKTLRTNSLNLFKDFDKPMVQVEELLELINMEKEDFEEILDMISRAKEKLEFFSSHIECLVNSLKENFKHLTVNNLRKNTYVKKIYRKKLEEFASGLAIKIKKSIKVLEVEFDILKENIGKIAETCEMISEFNENCINGEEKWISLIKILNQLLDEMYSNKSKQLMEIKEVSYIETDVEMLYDLYRRFSSIEGFNSLRTFNFMQQSC